MCKTCTHETGRKRSPQQLNPPCSRHTARESVGLKITSSNSDDIQLQRTCQKSSQTSRFDSTLSNFRGSEGDGSQSKQSRKPQHELNKTTVQHSALKFKVLHVHSQVLQLDSCHFGIFTQVSFHVFRAVLDVLYYLSEGSVHPHTP